MDDECISKEPPNIIDPEQIEFEIDLENEVCLVYSLIKTQWCLMFLLSH